MNKSVFTIMNFIYEQREKCLTQRIIAEGCKVSLGTVNAIISEIRAMGYIDDDYKLTEDGYLAMSPYRVDNAVILAAGMSTRFVPFSYEKPKGLTVVKGEVLIERQIRQLREVGIKEIILVLGHMMEKFLYLMDKYDVKVVVNNEYRYKNTHSSIYFARDYLKNSYICCADNYFPNNIFHRYEYRSIYSVVYMPGIWRGERGVYTDDNGLIIKTQRPAVDQWVMNGYAYFDTDFSKGMIHALSEMWNTPGSEGLYWEQVYAEHVEELKLYAVKYEDDQILEFDSVAELEKFDPEYIKYNDIEMTRNICKIFNCSSADIHEIVPIEKGYTNKSFVFSCGNARYIYRTPGSISAAWIDRKSEKQSLEIAKRLGIDDSYIYEDEKEGWKISSYVETTDTFDFKDITHVKMLCELMRKLYSSSTSCGKLWDYLYETKQLLLKIKKIDEQSYSAAADVLEQIEAIDRSLKNDAWPIQLVHNDIYEDNLLVADNKLYLIDWEYAGDSDIGFDICKLFVKNRAIGEELDMWVSYYYGRIPTEHERVHLIRCAVVSFYYWYVWALYMVKCGNDYSNLLMQYMEIYKMYKKELLIIERGDK